MARKFEFAVSCSLWLVVLLLPGCRPSQEGTGNTPTSRSSQESTESKTLSPSTNAKLKNINLAYCNYCTSYGRAPVNVEELAPFVISTVFPESHRRMEEEWLRQLKQGETVVIWNQKDVSGEKEGTALVTAYEKRTPVQGGFVVYADGRVEWRTPAELERILKCVEMASPEVKLTLDVPDRETMKSELEKALKKVDSGKSKQDLVNLQGLWEIVGIEHGKVALLGPAEVGDPILVVGDKLHFKHKTWEGKYRFDLDPTKDPKWIDTFVVEGEGEGVRGIYSLTKDEFKLCYDPSSSTRPTEFDTKVDFVRALFILKRVMPKQSLEKSGKVK